jgi:hypothetical protein
MSGDPIFKFSGEVIVEIAFGVFANFPAGDSRVGRVFSLEGGTHFDKSNAQENSQYREPGNPNSGNFSPLILHARQHPGNFTGRTVFPRFLIFRRFLILWIAAHGDIPVEKDFESEELAEIPRNLTPSLEIHDKSSTVI